MSTRKPINMGHGHVHPRPDGVKARCGGPAMCPVCATDVVEAYAPLVHWKTRDDGNSEWATYVEGDWSVHVMDKDGDASDWDVKYRGESVIESGDIFDHALPTYHFDLAKAAAIGALREAQRAVREHLDALPCVNCWQKKKDCDLYKDSPRFKKACCGHCDHSPQKTFEPRQKRAAFKPSPAQEKP